MHAYRVGFTSLFSVLLGYPHPSFIYFYKILNKPDMNI